MIMDTIILSSVAWSEYTLFFSISCKDFHWAKHLFTHLSVPSYKLFIMFSMIMLMIIVKIMVTGKCLCEIDKKSFKVSSLIWCNRFWYLWEFSKSSHVYVTMETDPLVSVCKVSLTRALTIHMVYYCQHQMFIIIQAGRAIRRHNSLNQFHCFNTNNVLHVFEYI